MAKRKFRIKKPDLAATTVAMIKGSALTAGGYIGSNVIGAELAKQSDMLRTTKAQAVVKGLLTVGTAMMAYKSKQYRLEGVALATGMGLSAIADTVAVLSPETATAYLPLNPVVIPAPAVGGPGVNLYMPRGNRVPMNQQVVVNAA